jgi:hypothetical protein
LFRPKEKGMVLEMPSWFQSLELEARLAMTFIDLANTPDQEKSARCLANAREAYAQIQRALMKPAYHGLSEAQIAFLDRRRTEIETSMAGLKNSN